MSINPPRDIPCKLRTASSMVHVLMKGIEVYFGSVDLSHACWDPPDVPDRSVTFRRKEEKVNHRYYVLVKGVTVECDSLGNISVRNPEMWSRITKRDRRETCASVF